MCPSLWPALVALATLMLRLLRGVWEAQPSKVSVEIGSLVWKSTFKACFRVSWTSNPRSWA